MQKRLYIKDLKIGDVLVDHNFAIKKLEKKMSKNNKEYYNVELVDRTGTVEGKIWSNAFADCEIEEAKIGSVVQTTGKIDSFNDHPQVIIDKFKIIEDFNPDHFLNVGEKDRDEIFNKIMTEVESLEDEEIKGVIRSIFADEELVKKYKESPAGEKVHHSYVGGLLEHVYEMLEVAMVTKNLYPNINYSELVFGILFHDIGKLEELGINGVALTRTVSGYMVGHLTQGILFLEKYLNDLDENKKNKLLHLILSHHGEEQYGSPVKPMTLEAILLSQIDMLSSRMGIAYSHLRESEINERGMTPYNRYLGTSLFPSTQ